MLDVLSYKNTRQSSWDLDNLDNPDNPDNLDKFVKSLCGDCIQNLSCSPQTRSGAPLAAAHLSSRSCQYPRNARQMRSSARTWPSWHLVAWPFCACQTALPVCGRACWSICTWLLSSWFCSCVIRGTRSSSVAWLACGQMTCLVGVGGLVGLGFYQVNS